MLLPEPRCGPPLTPHLGKPPLHRELFSWPSLLVRGCSNLQVRDLGWAVEARGRLGCL